MKVLTNIMKCSLFESTSPFANKLPPEHIVFRATVYTNLLTCKQPTRSCEQVKDYLVPDYRACSIPCAGVAGVF